MKPRAWVVGQIFKKELLETLRDRRTLLMMVVIPAVLYPALIGAMTRLTARQVEKLHGEAFAVAAGPGLPEVLRRRLEEARITLVPLGADSPRAVLASRRAAAVLVADAACATAAEREERCSLTVHYDDTLDRSLAALSRVTEAARAWEEAEVDRRAAVRGLKAAFHKPLVLTKKSVATQAERAGNLAGRILPALLISLVLAGAYAPAVDLSAGEKERGTMQTLLCAPVSPLEIVGGKYLAVALFALASGAVNLGALAVALMGGLSQLAPVGSGLSPGPVMVAVSPLLYGAIFLLVTPLALVFSALALAVGAFAKSYREAQSYVAPLYLVAVLPATLASLPGVELEGGLVLVPVLNLAVLLRELFVGRALWAVPVVLGVNLALAALSLWFAARVYSTEEAMLGSGKGAIAAVLRRKGHR